jgi:hypothetical protein
LHHLSKKKNLVDLRSVQRRRPVLILKATDRLVISAGTAHLLIEQANELTITERFRSFEATLPR